MHMEITINMVISWLSSGYRWLSFSSYRWLSSWLSSGYQWLSLVGQWLSCLTSVVLPERNASALFQGYFPGHWLPSGNISGGIACSVRGSSGKETGRLLSGLSLVISHLRSIFVSGYKRLSLSYAPFHQQIIRCYIRWLSAGQKIRLRWLSVVIVGYQWLSLVIVVIALVIGFGYHKQLSWLSVVIFKLSGYQLVISGYRWLSNGYHWLNQWLSLVI